MVYKFEDRAGMDRSMPEEMRSILDKYFSSDLAVPIQDYLWALAHYSPTYREHAALMPTASRNSIPDDLARRFTDAWTGERGIVRVLTSRIMALEGGIEVEDLLHLDEILELGSFSDFWGDGVMEASETVLGSLNKDYVAAGFAYLMDQAGR